MFASEVVGDAIKVEGDVGFGEALELADPEVAVERGWGEGGEFLQGLGLGDVGF